MLEFGPSRRYVGILTHPGGGSDGVRTALLLANSGIIHRSGPNRLHVHVARALAAQGTAVLRYDLPGIGDSETAPATGDVARDQVSGTLAAVAAMQRSGIADRFVIFGICAGADHAFNAVAADTRLAGAIMVDPTWVFSTGRHELNSVARLVRRAVRPRVIRRVAGALISKRSEALRIVADPFAPQLLQPRIDIDEWTRTRDALTSLAARDARLLLVTTRHNSSVYSYDRQFVDAFRSVHGIDRVVESVRRTTAAHTFTREVDRRFIEEYMGSWLGRLPAASGTTTA